MKKKWLIIIPLLIAVGLFAGYKYVYKDHRDIAAEEAEFTLKVSDLQKAFTENDSLANAKYADKTIVVSGKVTSTDNEARTITLDDKLSATMSQQPKSATPGQLVTIKGRFVGYDDLLEELKMDQVTITN